MKSVKNKQWRLGVPRALLYYYYGPWWEAFFQALGVETVVSPPTGREIMDRGVGLAVAEACLPVKVYYGHAAWLAPRVDVLFVPRLVSVEHKAFICPKLMGLPDMLRAAIKDCPPVLAPTVDLARRPDEGLQAAIRAIARALDVRVGEAAAAGETAGARYREWLARQREAGAWLGNGPPGGCPAGRSPSPGEGQAARGAVPLTVGVIGHSYLLYDRYLGLDIPNKIARLGGRVVLPENLAPEAGERACHQLPKRLYWTLGRKIMGTALYLMEQASIDGLIHLTAFGCGPDSLVGDLAERYAHRRSKPFLLLTLDEHTGEAGLNTRLEAFMDMLKRRRTA
ncbi:MAG: hypothetical protein PWQ18_924 [Clostridia bacterium]|nr:hypothetical protein [Clostridia bacterium]